MVINRGRKRAKEKRKLDRRKEKIKVKQFGTLITDKRGNQRISLD